MEKTPQIAAVEQWYRGRRVTLTGDHPHATASGTIARVEYAQALGRWGFVVDLESGEACFVFTPQHWRVW